MPYKEVFQSLVNIGLVDVILPFLLVFTIMYATLQRTQVLGQEHGKPKKKLNAMTSFVLGFLVVLATNLLGIINTIVAYFALIVISAVMIAIILGLAGATTESKIMRTSALGLTGIIVLYAFYASGITQKNPIWTILALAAIILALIYINKKEQTQQKQNKKEHGPQQERRPPSPEESEAMQDLLRQLQKAKPK